MLLTGMGEDVDEGKSQVKSKKSQEKKSKKRRFGSFRVRRGDEANGRWGEFIIGKCDIVLFVSEFQGLTFQWKLSRIKVHLKGVLSGR
jgi:hypothetical protein